MGVPYQPGDPVIFNVSKMSVDPGPRAHNIHPAAHGELYSYFVPKFWRVQNRDEAGNLVLVTRRGKTHVVEPNDPRLRRPKFWERWLYSSRFPSVPAGSEPGSSSGVLQRSML